MLFDSQITFATVCIAAWGFLLLYWSLRVRARNARLPPGPTRLPFIGSVLQIPQNDMWVTCAKWAKEYNSDIIHFDAAGRSIVVVNTLQAADEILDVRSAKYSSRPRLVMINELLGLDWFFANMKYGPEWRESRRLFQKHVTPGNKLHRVYETKYVRQMLQQFLKKPEGFMDHLRHLAGATTLAFAYGVDIQPENDPLVELAEEALTGPLVAGVPGAFLVDSIPILKYVPAWLPGASFKRKARHWKKKLHELLHVPFKRAEEGLSNASITPCFVSACLESIDEAGDVDAQKKAIREVAGAIFIGGADTTVSSFGSLILSMLIHPEVQQKAQEELDRVVGRDRLPTHEDEPNLPYISSVVKELLRWSPVAPIAVPHASTQDDIYDGRLIPKDSIVVANVWAMLHDELRYPDPFSFKPERFLTTAGEIDRDVLDPASVAFGFGRRVCPAKHIGLSLLWLTTASVLATFNLEKAVDENGNVIEPSGEYSTTLIRRPLPFKCKITPRSADAVQLLLELSDS